jgi:ribulose-5-phosphate 4-epimerase/fuculose-1-phosphate aldolase
MPLGGGNKGIIMSEIIIDIDEARRDLAAIFRWTARESMHEGIANHFSYAISDDGQQFLMNPYGVHFSKMRASDLLLLDARKTPSDYGQKVDPTAWWIHGAMHRYNPQARCIVHLHSHYATALSALKDPTLLPVDQTSCRFFNRVAVDSGFDGMGLDDEAERLSTILGNKRMMMMGNHGFMTVAESPALAFDLAYYYERACRTYLTAKGSGLELSVLSNEIAEKTAKQWEAQDQTVDQHLAAIRRILDDEDPEYRH